MVYGPCQVQTQASIVMPDCRPVLASSHQNCSHMLYLHHSAKAGVGLETARLPIRLLASLQPVAQVSPACTSLHAAASIARTAGYPADSLNMHHKLGAALLRLASIRARCSRAVTQAKTLAELGHNNKTESVKPSA